MSTPRLHRLFACLEKHPEPRPGIVPVETVSLGWDAELEDQPVVINLNVEAARFLRAQQKHEEAHLSPEDIGASWRVRDELTGLSFVIGLLPCSCGRRHICWSDPVPSSIRQLVDGRD